MLQKQNRLRKTNEFKRTFRSGKGYKTQGLMVKAREGEKAAARIGIIVSKKVAKEAVKRNRIRRILASAVRELLPALRDDRDIVLTVLPGFKPTKAQEALEEVGEAFQKASLFK